MFVISYSEQEEECRQNIIPTARIVICELNIVIGVWFGSVWVPWKLKELRQGF